MAAGAGTRLSAGTPKALAVLGRGPSAAPIVVHALRSALGCGELTDVVVVGPPAPAALAELTDAICRERTRGRHTDDHDADDRGAGAPDDAVALAVVAGGSQRADSVSLGLAALPAEVDIVMVHDAARALTPADVFDRVIAAVRAGEDAVTPALPVTDTIKRVQAGPDGESVVDTPDRAALRAIQTPQGFRRQTLERAHASVQQPVTDDCGLVEALGGRVRVVAGSPRAFKITTPHDLELATMWLDRRPAVLPDPAARVLIIFSGLPGVGKTTLARALSRRLGAVHLRVDAIEQGLLRGGLSADQLGAAGYGAAYAVAADQLAAGFWVVADMVNGLAVVRAAWQEVAAAAGARVVKVMVECSDLEQHRRQVTGRIADIEGHRLPDWHDVLERDLEAWPEADLRIDTASEPPDAAIDRLIAYLQESSP